jgi:hypothetical protein
MIMRSKPETNGTMGHYEGVEHPGLCAGLETEV